MKGSFESPFLVLLPVSSFCLKNLSFFGSVVTKKTDRSEFSSGTSRFLSFPFALWSMNFWSAFPAGDVMSLCCCHALFWIRLLFCYRTRFLFRFWCFVQRIPSWFLPVLIQHKMMWISKSSEKVLSVWFFEGEIADCDFLSVSNESFDKMHLLKFV